VFVALESAARRGVACRLLLDGLGSRAFLKSPRHRELLAAGVQVVEALPVGMLRRRFGRGARFWRGGGALCSRSSAALSAIACCALSSPLSSAFSRSATSRIIEISVR
jgi:hypothetical protein